MLRAQTCSSTLKCFIGINSIVSKCGNYMYSTPWDIFTHSSLQNGSSPFRLNGGCLWTMSYELEWFRSGLAEKWTCSDWNHRSGCVFRADGRWTSAPVSSLWQLLTVFLPDVLCVYFDQAPYHCWRKAVWCCHPVFHGGDGVFRSMQTVWFSSHFEFCMLTKMFHFDLIWPEHLLPRVLCPNIRGKGA